MLRQLVTAISLAALTTLAVAQSDPIATRKDIMKANGQKTRLGVQMVKGEAPFDLAKAQDIYTNYIEAAAKFPTLFPDDSKTGEKTTASPKIWEDKADFQARFDAWAKDVKAAQADTKDLDTFRASFSKVTKACGSCHDVYRIKT